MIVKNLRREQLGGNVRLSADIVHETVPAPFAVIYYEVEERHADLLTDSYAPFLIAALVPAVFHGEARIVVEGDVAPLLVAGLRCVMGWHHHWYGKRHAPIAIEAGTRATALPRRPSAVYLSGGIDSMFTLRRNQLGFPAGHACRADSAILVNGFDVRRPDAIRIARDHVQQIADAATLELITVSSNVPLLDDDYPLWAKQFGGAAFCSVAHALAPGFQRVWFSANSPIPDLTPWTLHPATDPNYSSADVEIRQEGLEFTCVEKVRLLAHWDVALRHARVCTRNPVDRLNCGQCEKCIRTQLAFLLAGRLSDASVFPNDDITVAQVRAVRIRNEGQARDNHDLVRELRAAGRANLARAVAANLREYEKWVAWRDGTGLRHRAARVLGFRH
ncbi:MAG: hypothetical protein GZ089_00120 [Aromatoleum sp.]|nr:hypothetical protein [Aromatoleum sp.]